MSWQKVREEDSSRQKIMGMRTLVYGSRGDMFLVTDTLYRPD